MRRHLEVVKKRSVEIVDRTEFKCPFCVVGQCAGGVDSELGAVITHTLPYCLVFDELSGFDFLRMCNRLQALSAFRKVARA